VPLQRVSIAQCDHTTFLTRTAGKTALEVLCRLQILLGCVGAILEADMAWRHSKGSASPKSLTCRDSPRGISPWLDKWWIVDFVIGTSQWVVVTHQGVVPLSSRFVDQLGHMHMILGSVCFSMRGFFELVMIWPLSAISRQWPWNMHFLWTYMCQWHGMVFYEYICVNGMEWYILLIDMCQWHGMVYSMIRYVSMTRNGIMRRCRIIGQVVYVLFVTFESNHTMVGLEGLLRCKSILNVVKFGDQVCREGHESPAQKWSPRLLYRAIFTTEMSKYVYRVKSCTWLAICN